MKKTGKITIIITTILLLTAVICSGAWVTREGERVFIEDRTGERWDVTEAQSLGFVPHKFQYGIGKNAFTPLQDEDFEGERVSAFLNTRIIGISVKEEAHAYAVNRLRHHEIANTTIAGEAIAAGY